MWLPVAYNGGRSGITSKGITISHQITHIHSLHNHIVTGAWYCWSHASKPGSHWIEIHVPSPWHSQKGQDAWKKFLKCFCQPYREREQGNWTHQAQWRTCCQWHQISKKHIRLHYSLETYWIGWVPCRGAGRFEQKICIQVTDWRFNLQWLCGYITFQYYLHDLLPWNSVLVGQCCLKDSFFLRLHYG